MPARAIYPAFLRVMSEYQVIRFSLKLSYDQYLNVYRGVAKKISVIADDGRRIQFPAGKIQSFLTQQGIQGYFEMLVTAQNKFIQIRKIH